MHTLCMVMMRTRSPLSSVVVGLVELRASTLLACRLLRSLAVVVTGTRHSPETCWLAHIPVEWAAGKTIRGVVVEKGGDDGDSVVHITRGEKW